jgi:glycosyltransferase involved in cell wall biosynthesis
MINEIKLTIALLTYNRSKYLEESLSAILSQTYKEFELLVVDNNSSDSTSEMMIQYSDPRLKYIRLPPEGNPASGNNFAMQAASGDYILITHDDDIMEATLVEKQMKFLEENTGIMALASNVSLIDRDGKVLQKQLYNLADNVLFDKGEYISRYLGDKFWLPAPTTIYHRKTYRRVMKVFDDTGKHMPSGDVLALLLLNLKGGLGILSDPLLRYRQHSEQESRNVNQSKPHLELFNNALSVMKLSNEAYIFLPGIHAMFLKYKVQDIIFDSLGDLQGVTDAMLYMEKYLNDNVKLSDRKADEFFILDLMLNKFGKESCASYVCDSYAEIGGGISVNYKRWLDRSYLGVSLFDLYSKVKKIAVFGSMLTAFLIVKEAVDAGVDVVCCLDSSTQRVGRSVLGVPVLSSSLVNDIESEVDMIVLSSEREHDDALREILKSRLINKDMDIISWKDMLCSL